MKLLRSIFSGVLFLIIGIGCGPQESGELSQPSDVGVRSATTVPEALRLVDHLTVYPSDTEPPFAMQLIREESFGDTEDVLVSMAPLFPVAVDNRNRVYITDVQMFIHLFESDGSYISRLGREGEGPGEFRQIRQLIIHDGKLWVYDSHLRRISLFSTETHEFESMILFLPDNSGRIENPGGATPLMLRSILDDGSYLVSFYQIRGPYFEPEDPEVDGYYRFYSVSEDGRSLRKKLFEQSFSILFPVREPIWIPKPVPFDLFPVTTFSSYHHFYTVETRHFYIRVYDTQGTYLRSFYYPFMNRKVTREESQEVPGTIRSPDIWPAIQEMKFDDENRLWVATIVESDLEYKWWVLEENGSLISKFRWPQNRPIVAIRNGSIYTRETEEETGLDQIIRYRIEMEEAK